MVFGVEAAVCCRLSHLRAISLPPFIPQKNELLLRFTRTEARANGYILFELVAPVRCHRRDTALEAPIKIRGLNNLLQDLIKRLQRD